MSLLYEKIAKVIEDRINNDVYKIQERIPGENKLAKELNTARPTIHKALILLEKKGLVESRASVGCFVIKKARIKRLYAYIAPNLSDPYHAEFIRIFNSLIVNDGGNLLIDDNSQTSSEDIFKRLESENIDGVIFCPNENDDSELLARFNIPIIWTATIPKSKNIDYIVVDNDKGIKSILQYFKDLGLNSVGYIEGNKASAYSSRKDLFLKNLDIYGLKSKKEWILKSKINGEAGGRELFNNFNDLVSKPEGIVCYNDWNAIGFMEAAIEHGVKIPNELRITGFDNLYLSKLYKVPLTTIDSELNNLASESYKMLLNRIRNISLGRQKCIANCNLIIRKS